MQKLIIDACMHITTDNINSEFYSSICQHHINCSIHIFIIRDNIIFKVFISKEAGKNAVDTGSKPKQCRYFEQCKT